MLNTTFEKEEEDKENIQPPPSFNKDAKDSAGDKKKNMEKDDTEEGEEEDAAISNDKFHTPELTDEVSDVFISPSDDHVEKLLKSILELAQKVYILFHVFCFIEWDMTMCPEGMILGYIHSLELRYWQFSFKFGCNASISCIKFNHELMIPGELFGGENWRLAEEIERYFPCG